MVVPPNWGERGCLVTALLKATSEVFLFQKKTTWFWSWVHYVCLHLPSVHRRVKRLLWPCGYWVPKTSFSLCNQVANALSKLAKNASKCTQLHIHASCPVHRQANCCSETFFLWYSLSEHYLRHVDIRNHLCVLLMSKFKILRRQKHQ